MGEVLVAVDEVVGGQDWATKCGSRVLPMFSLDNATIHGDKDALKRLKINKAQYEETPARSPDFHKPIEHLFGRMKNAFQSWLHSHPNARTTEEYMAKLEELFQQCATKEQIDADVESMIHTYDAIVKCQGGWISKSLR